MKPYIADEREEMIWSLHRQGHSLRDIGDIFNTPRATINSIVKRQPKNWKASWVKRGFADLSLYHATYRAWAGLKRRCSNPNDRGYKNYGGRGITFDPRWENFENFLLDMGIKPKDSYSIDRIDPDGHYTPNNCRWTDSKTQALNKRGKKKTQVYPESLQKKKNTKK